MLSQRINQQNDAHERKQVICTPTIFGFDQLRAFHSCEAGAFEQRCVCHGAAVRRTERMGRKDSVQWRHGAGRGQQSPSRGDPGGQVLVGQLYTLAATRRRGMERDGENIIRVWRTLARRPTFSQEKSVPEVGRADLSADAP